MPLEVRITFVGIDRVNRMIERTNRRFKQLSPREFANQVVVKARNILRRRYNYSRKNQRTGYLESSIRAEVIKNRARIIADAEYAPIVEHGRGAITVTPPHKMAFIGREGNLIFTSHVKETKAKRFMADARAWAKRYFPEYMRKKVERIVASKARYVTATNVNASSLSAQMRGVGGKRPGTVRSARGLLTR